MPSSGDGSSACKLSVSTLASVDLLICTYWPLRSIHLLILAEFEKPVETVRGRVTLCPKQIPEGSMGDRTHCADGTAVRIALIWSFEDVPHIHQLPPKLIDNPLPKALQNPIRERCGVGGDP